jgi:hypothetical protein
MTTMVCPECKDTVDERGAVSLEVSLSAGDDAAGSSSTARLALCGACGGKLLTKYTALAVETQQRLAQVPR